MSAGSRASGAVMMATSSAVSEPMGHGGCSTREDLGKFVDQALRLLGIALHDGEHGGDVNVRHLLVPTVVVGDHGDGRVANLGFAGELGFRHVGHADHVASPAAIEERLRARGKLRAFHDKVGPARRMVDVLGLSGLLDCLHQ